MHSDEDLEPRTRSPVAHPQPSVSTQYTWLDCEVQGWQVLMTKPTDCGVLPKPPDCVLRSHKSPRSLSPNHKHLVTTSPDSPITPTRFPVPDNEASFSLPQKNFVLANIRNTSSPRRHTRSALLEKASSQLRETEMMSASLAERLNVIQNRLIG